MLDEFGHFSPEIVEIIKCVNLAVAVLLVYLLPWPTDFVKW